MANICFYYINIFIQYINSNKNYQLYLTKISRLKTKINISLLFSLVVLCELYIVSFRISLILEFIFFAILLLSSDAKVSKKYVLTILPVILLFLIGFVNTFFSDYLPINIFKDITHFIKPILVLSIGYVTFKNINDKSIFVKTITRIALFTAFIHLFGVFFLSNFLSSSINNIRDENGFDNFIEIYALFFLIIAPKYNITNFYKNETFRKIYIVFLLLSITMYFSRTMFGMLLFLGFSFYGFGKISKKGLQLIGVLIISIGLFYFYLNSIKIDRNGKGIEALIYKIKMAPGEVFNSKVNREDHSKLWDHWRAYEAKQALVLMSQNPSSYFIGNGYGSLVNLKFRAPLGDGNGMRYISTLHNGYVYVLYKTGFLGIIIYFIFLVSLYKRIYYNTENRDKMFFKIVISTIGIYFLFTSIIITGIYIPKDVILFILGGALFHENNL